MDLAEQVELMEVGAPSCQAINPIDTWPVLWFIKDGRTDSPLSADLIYPNGIEVNDMNTQDFHTKFDDEVYSLLEPVRDELLEGSETCTREEILAQLMMNNLFPHVLDPEVDDYDEVFKGRLTVEQKKVLVGIASHMGPDWAQALYHAAVFITKVA